MAKKPNSQTNGTTDKVAPEENKLSGKVIIITGPEGGRWRAGRRFGPTPTEIPVEEFDSEDDIKVFLDDPKLSVKPGEASKPVQSEEE